MPRTFADIVHLLVHEDRFVRGTLALGGNAAAPSRGPPRARSAVTGNPALDRHRRITVDVDQGFRPEPAYFLICSVIEAWIMTPENRMDYPVKSIALPMPRLESGCSLEAALQRRRSVRAFGDEPLALAEAAQLAWAAQGVTGADGLRSAPSAGSLYPIELYLAARNVDGLAPAIYKYLPEVHRLRQWVEGDRGHELAIGALNQDFVKRAAVVLVFAAVELRTTDKYRERGIRYVHIEIGHAAQNVLLQAVALGLSAVVVGAFDDLHVRKSLHMSETEQARYLIPVGNP